MRLLPLLALLAIAGLGCVDTDFATNRPPVADAGRDLRAVQRQTVVYLQLDASGSADADGDPMTYRWSVVRAPDAMVLSTAQRDAADPIVGLRASGLYIFELRVRDPLHESAPDYVNVWVVDGLLAPDAELLDQGSEDAGAEDADVPDVSDEGLEDADTPDEGLEDAEVVDAARVDAAGPNQPPEAVITFDADRVRLGERLHMNAHDSRDDRQPAPLTYTWRVVGAPFEVEPSGEGAGAEFTFQAVAPGRYTFELTADDSELRHVITRSAFVDGDIGWVLYPRIGLARPYHLSDGTDAGDLVALGDVTGAVGFTARAGVLYVTVSGPNHRGALVVAIPGRPVIRRVLPADGVPGAPVAGPDGIWTPMTDAPNIFFSDALSTRAFVNLTLPQTYLAGSGLAVDGTDGFFANRRQPGALLDIDLERRRLRAVMVSGSALCPSPASPIRRDAWLYATCWDQNQLVRLAPDHRGDLAVDAAIALPDGPLPRATKLTETDGWLVVRHLDTDYVTVVDTEAFDLPLGAAGRGAHQRVIVEDTVLDLAAAHGVFYALNVDANGVSTLRSYDAASGAMRWRRPLNNRNALFLTLDSATDFSINLGEL